MFSRISSDFSAKKRWQNALNEEVHPTDGSPVPLYYFISILCGLFLQIMNPLKTERHIWKQKLKVQNHNAVTNC